jgi:putative membrane-bound dehydrogenase-like protein
MKTVALFLVIAGSLLAEDFPEVYNSEKNQKGEPMSPEEAAMAFQVPEGFEVTVFASEPEVRNPIAMTWDLKGRMWVAENYTYAERGKRFDLNLRDRVVIFEDTDRDGKADKRTVFADDLQMLASVEVQPGGVWLMCPPQLLFVPDRDGDLVPDGEPEVVLDGFTVAKSNYHNFANGLRWGPDGWLYGRCGGSCPGEVGAPGTPKEERVPLRGGIWRYHPTRKFFEVIVHGTTNPWGHDWDEHGEGFFINTVNGHLWHIIPGGHFDRPFGRSVNPLVYEAIQMHADHWHFDTTGSWTKSRNGAANEFGGGHAHIGMCIYQGNHLPKEWQGKLLTWNMHGRRLNRERLERKGSGYVARHEPDQFLAGDEWFRGLEIRQGPDGALYGLDWCDTGECHDHTGVHRTSGRIYRFSYRGSVKQTRLKMGPIASKLANLRERHQKNTLPRKELLGLLNDENEHLRVWAVRLLTDTWPIDSVYGPMPHRKPPSDPELRDRFVEMAIADSSGLVRLALASTLQRMPLKDRPVLASALASRVEDANDHNLPRLVWFALMTMNKEKLQVAAATDWPDLLRYLARSSVDGPKMVDQLLVLASQHEKKSAPLLKGLLEGFKGWRKAPLPVSWGDHEKVLQDRHAEMVRELSALFGDGRALALMKATALNGKESLPVRKRALEGLIDARFEGLRPVCEELLTATGLGATAARGLSIYDDPAIGKLMLKNYKRLRQDGDRAAVISALATRPAWASMLLAEVKKGGIPGNAITPFDARQISSLKRGDLSKQLGEVWGKVSPSTKALEKKIADYRKSLTPKALSSADKGQGRVHFETLCASCHQLYGKGGKLGPDLTGSGRANLDYLLENIVSPGAVMPLEYQMSTVLLKDGRTLSGMISASDERTVTLRSPVGETILEQASIVKTTRLPDSLMPPGLLDTLTPEQVRELIAYLMHPRQVELPEKK